MSRHVALLRGVNVGGNKGVPMAALKALAQALSLGDPRTLLQSGNLVFSSDGKPAGLEPLLERAIKDDMGVETKVCVRTAAQWSDLVQANPFRREAKAAPGHLVLVAFKDAPKSAAPEAIAKAYAGPERIEVVGDHAFIVYPDGIGRSKLTPTLIARHLGEGTARNWNTVLKIEAALNAD